VLSSRARCQRPLDWMNWRGSSKTFFKYTVTSRDLHYRCCEEAKIEISGTHEVGVLSEWSAGRLAAREQRFLAIELDK
jgi:hypothetical protein